MQTFVRHLCQRAVGDIFGERHRQLAVHFGSGHQRSSAGNVLYPFKQLVQLRGEWCANLVADGGVVLYNVWRGAACVNVGVVDAHLWDNVLPQVVAADAHQLNGIQCAASHVGSSSGVAGATLEMEVGSDDGIGLHPLNGVLVAWMPGVDEIHMVKQSGARHELLGACALFGRTAEIDDGSVFSGLLQIILDGKHGSQRACTQRTVSAAVSGASRHYRLWGCGCCLLAQAGQGIKFS